MYSFNDLHGSHRPDWKPSLAYWFGDLKTDLPEKFQCADELASAMTLHYDIEDQAWDEEHIRTFPELLFEVFQPIAPVTFTEEWSPFPLAIQLLGKPQVHGRGDRSAYGIFPKSELRNVSLSNVHEEHFASLLQQAVSSNQGQRVLLVCKPGWSYTSCIRGGRLPKHTREIMKSVGYKYTEHVRFPRWRVWYPKEIRTSRWS